MHRFDARISGMLWFADPLSVANCEQSEYDSYARELGSMEQKAEIEVYLKAKHLYTDRIFQAICLYLNAV